MTFARASRIALIDDDDDFREALAERLRLEGFDVAAFAGGEAALRALDRRFEGVVISDLRMPGMDGRQLAERARRLDSDLPVILMTGHGDVAEAVEAMKSGAYDFLAKPFAPERLIETVSRALEKRGLVLDNRRLSALAEEQDVSIPLSGESRAAESLRAAIRQIAEVDVDVLIEGETGSGKEAVARSIHNASRRRARPFVPIACGALTGGGVGAQLFGHEAGAFPGAIRRQDGQISRADGGVLFLDEIDQAPSDVQGVLARVVEEREILPAGAVEPKIVDIRILAATRTDPASAVTSGVLRDDLYHRLNVVRLRVPPLRERREDIPMLFARFLDRAAARMGRDRPTLDDAIRRRLLDDDWPGNLRELSNLANRLVVGLTEAEMSDAGEQRTLAERVARYEADLLRQSLDTHVGDIRRVAHALGLPRKTLYDKMARHGLTAATYRGR